MVSRVEATVRAVVSRVRLFIATNRLVHHYYDPSYCVIVCLDSAIATLEAQNRDERPFGSNLMQTEV